MSEEVITQVENGILIVTINRPQARNAINRATSEKIGAAMEELDENPDIRVGILTGAGGTFCSGMDLKAFVSGESPALEGRGFAGLVESLPEKPLIAAVEGYALAGGFEIALSCDLIIASKSAQFGVPEVKRGLVAAGGGLLRLPTQTFHRLAMELALTGDFIDSARAYQTGLVNHVVEDGKALEAAIEMAEKICENGPLAVAASKKIVNSARDWSNDEMFQKEKVLSTPILTSEDAIEGATAFAEKRTPQWKGK